MEQEQNNIPLGRQLVRLGFVTEAMVRDLVAHTIGQESIDLSTVIADSDALKMVPEEFARRYHLLPIANEDNLKLLTVAMADMFNVVALDQLRAMLGGQIQLCLLYTSDAADERSSGNRHWQPKPSWKNISTSSTVMSCRSMAFCAKSRLAKSIIRA